jgi:dTDP-4-dehydrorhamnose 3,5-epimerase
MRVDWSELAGVTVVDSIRHVDDRGSFAKLFDADTGAGLSARQVCMSTNHVRGTVRGLHVQVAPFPETKRIWCAAGELWDVLVDLRQDEPTYGAWAAVELSALEPRLLCVPPGVAHGFQTMTDDCVIVYLIDGFYSSESSRTLLWNDPDVAVEWPLPPTRISPTDARGEPWPIRF